MKATAPLQRVSPARRRLLRRLAWPGIATLSILGACFALLAATTHGTPSGSTSAEQAVSYVDQQLRAQGSPRSAFAVVHDGRISESGTLGDGITINTPFSLGSLSKSFTALSVSQLVDDGLVGLDDPVNRYITWFRTADPTATITVRQLLNQTSGLPTWAGTVDLTKPETTLEQRVRAVADVEPVTVPGTTFHYCNTNYATLGLLVEKVTGMKYADYLQRNILDPLEMDRTFTSYTKARRAGLTDGSSIWFGARVDRTAIDFPGALPDGSLISTVGDLAHYIEMQRDGTYSGQRIVSEKMLRDMHTGTFSDDAGSRYGFGWRDAQVNGRRVLQHEGDLSNFHANLGIITETDTALVVLTAHNGQTFDTSAPYAEGLRILAGSKPPDIDKSYLIAQAAASAAAIITAVVLARGTGALIRRVRRIRMSDRGWFRLVAVPAFGYSAGSVALATLVYLGLWAALHEVLVVTPAIMFASLPDLSMIVAVAVGWLALAGITVLVSGVRRSASRSQRGESETAARNSPCAGYRSP